MAKVSQVATKVARRVSQSRVAKVLAHAYIRKFVNFASEPASLERAEE